MWLRVAIKLFKEGAEPDVTGFSLVNREISGPLGRFFLWCRYPLEYVEYFEHSSVVMANLSEHEYRELLNQYSDCYDISLLSTPCR